MNQITHSLSNLTLFADDSLQSSTSHTELLVHTCHHLHRRNAQLCLENERLKKQIECLLESACMVPQPNVVVPDWIK